ncbi:MAG: insulinase family protein [Bdellovibrionales bacterium]|nr:insulinase family protein [Bdellovibrionales bacterium]
MTHSKQHKAQLPNGLQVLGETSGENKSCAIGFFVNTGSRDETPSEAGLSHFLEHMMFKGTKNRSALDVTYELGNIGAQANAYTSDENTVYYAAVIPEYFTQMGDLLSDMLRPSLEAEEFNTEKNVILEEIALYQDRPHFYLFENALEHFFSSHPSGNSVLGTTASVSALTRDQMVDYFDRRYSPSNMTLVATGNYDWDLFVEQAHRCCGEWVNTPATRQVERFVPTTRSKRFTKSNITQSHVVLICDGASAQDDCRYEHTVLSMILGDVTGSRLYWSLVDTGIAESAGADNDSKDGTGCFMAYASCQPEDLEQVVDVLRQTLEAPLDFTEKDLEQAKNKLLSRMVLEGEMPIGRLMSLGLEWGYRQCLHSLQPEIERVKEVTMQSVRDALDQRPLSGVCEYTLELET